MNLSRLDEHRRDPKDLAEPVEGRDTAADYDHPETLADFAPTTK